MLEIIWVSYGQHPRLRYMFAASLAFAPSETDWVSTPPRRAQRRARTGSGCGSGRIHGRGRAYASLLPEWQHRRPKPQRAP